MKIYTKTGDNGTTALIGGRRVPKNHIRIETYGTIDELIANIGVVRDNLELKSLTEDLVRIQDHLMICAAILANDSNEFETSIPKLSSDVIVWLENNIDRMEKSLPVLTNFILPGGNRAVSVTHVARTVCRRAERCVLTLSESFEIPELILQYLNRLSDYLFVLSRFISHELNAKEIPWFPRLHK